MNRFLVFATLLISLISCQREIDVQLSPSSPGTGTGSPGGGNGTGTGIINYQPNTKGSYWTYKASGARTYESTTTSTGVKKTVNNIAYTVFVTTAAGAPPADGMYGMRGRDYFLSAAGVSPSSGAVFDITMKYLNDTAAVGYKWTFNAGQGNGFEAKIKGEVIERNMTVTVSGKTYKEVIHTQLQLTYTIPGFGDLPAALYDYYTANNVGIVRVLTTASGTVGGEVISSDLIDYSIK